MCAALVNSQSSPFTARSGGLFADGSPISENAARALLLAGIVSTTDNPYANHLSHTVCEEDVEWADVIVGVTKAHEVELKRRFPTYADKICSLPISISDPYGMDLTVYQQCLNEIRCAVTKLTEEWH